MLEYMARIEIAKGQYQAARLLLNLLSKDLVSRQIAKEILQQLDENSSLTGTDNSSPLLAVGHDDLNINNYSFILPELLKKDPRNKMAFEYLMADHLLNKRLEHFAAEIPHLRSLGYERMPTHYQQALAIIGRSGNPVDLQGYAMDPEIPQNFKKFDSILKKLISNKEAARNALVNEFGSTYFFYFKFGVPEAGK